MTITIDRAGRVVIPKEIRDRLHLEPGSELELEVNGEEITLQGTTAESRLVEKSGVLVFDSRTESEIDIADFINEQRSRRSVAAAE